MPGASARSWSPTPRIALCGVLFSPEFDRRVALTQLPTVGLLPCYVRVTSELCHILMRHSPGGRSASPARLSSALGPPWPGSAMLFVPMVSSESIPSASVRVPTGHNRKAASVPRGQEGVSNGRPLESVVGRLLEVVLVGIDRPLTLGLSERTGVGERVEIVPNCLLRDIYLVGHVVHLGSGPRAVAVLLEQLE